MSGPPGPPWGAQGGCTMRSEALWTPPGWSVVPVALLAGAIWAVAAVGQDDGFVGQPGQVGSFESFDPVLTDEVQTGLIPSGQFVQQAPGRDARLEFVAARLDQACPARETKPGVQPDRVDVHARGPHGLRHLAGQGTGLDGQVNHRRGQGHGAVQPPCDPTAEGQGGHHEHKAKGQEQAPHGWTGK